MELKMGEAVMMYDALLELSKSEAPFRVNYWIIKNKQELEPCFKTFSDERDKIYLECLTKDENGQYFTQSEDGTLHFNIEPDKIPIWNNRFEALNDFDVEISPYLLDIDALIAENPNWNFKADTLLTLEKLFGDDKSGGKINGPNSKSA